MELKPLLGTLSLVLSIISFMPYILDVIKRKTHPHAFSWLIWSALSAINFMLSLGQHGGAGAWVWGLIAGESLAVFLLGLAFGEHNLTRFDYCCLAGAMLAIASWLLTKQPVVAALLISAVQSLGFVPTFRKSYSRPYTETLSMYALGAVLLAVSIGALHEYSLQNILYPTVCASLNAAMMLFLYSRRLIVPAPRPKRPMGAFYLARLLLQSHAKRLAFRTTIV